MIPMWLKLRIPGHSGTMRLLTIPLILVWILVLPFFLILIPVWILTGIGVQASGHGHKGWLWLPLLISTLCHLKGLCLDIDSGPHRFTIAFH